ncbi:hypothetical protein CMI37_27030 [Candidatus Pacearchaeota archaeon]|nr:hypothetical protein [Candidatus Pacearchaeota archaeon]|tara:strand:- start:2188 stop:2877 length:690 start_codon:yes stop_codon:yes gene_type:complete
MSSDLIKDATESAIKGILSWSSDQIKTFVRKLKDKRLAFIQDEKTIKIVKEQYRSGELSFYKEHIKDKEMLFLLKMGLTLRKLEQVEELDRKQNLRTKIFNKYEAKGLHISQFVENGILNRYIGILIDNIISLDRFKKDILDILENIEKHVLFVQANDKEREIIQSTLSIVSNNLPSIFIVSGISSAASIVSNCEARLIELLKDYELEKISAGQKENLFFKRMLRKNQD